MPVNTENNSAKKTIHVVSFSGGLTSAYLVNLMEQKRLNEGWDVHYVFMDTGAEHPKTYAFVKKLITEWGINLVCLRAVISPIMGIGVSYREVELDELKPDLQPWKDMVAKYGLPTINAPRCTSRMKSDPHDKYCDEKFGRGNYITWLGIRQDEPARLKHFQSTIDMFDDKKILRPIRYLAELSPFGKSQVNTWWQQQSFTLDLPHHMGNCVFCIKKAEMKLVGATQAEPEMAKDFNAVIMGENVRKLPKQTFEQGVIYRGHLSMDKVIRLSRVLPAESINERLNQLSVFEDDDPSLCSESCEALASPDDFVLEMETEAA